MNKKPLISFIMPVKNEEKYIREAIDSIRNQAFTDWELIVIDDHSSDNTQEIVMMLSKQDGRIKPLINVGTGQAQALSCGYAKSAGSFIKFMDGDDLLPASFSNHINHIMLHRASYHDLEIVGKDLKPINVLRLTSKYEQITYSQFVRKMAPIPRGAWTLARDVADSVFPVPKEVRYADVWIALNVKRYINIVHIDVPLYMYRQHDEQVYNGIYNYSGEAVVRRARTMLSLVDYLEGEGAFLWQDVPDGLSILRSIRLYHSVLSLEKVGSGMILKTPLPLFKRAKLLVVKKSPGIASWLSRTKSRVRFRFLR